MHSPCVQSSSHVAGWGQESAHGELNVCLRGKLSQPWQWTIKKPVKKSLRKLHPEISLYRCAIGLLVLKVLCLRKGPCIFPDIERYPTSSRDLHGSLCLFVPRLSSSLCLCLTVSLSPPPSHFLFCCSGFLLTRRRFFFFHLLLWKICYIFSF